MPTVFQTDLRMPGTPETARPAVAAPATSSSPITREDTQDYFTEVAVDYSAWSPSYNMHFGFWRVGLNPFRREGMLIEMNRVVGRALKLDAPASLTEQQQQHQQQRRCVLDLGCGAGATARTLVGDDASLYAVTVTNVPVQNGIAAKLDAKAGVADRVAHMEADYTRTGLPAAQADGAWALESACYADGTAKADFVREAARLLKPGARLVVIDGFLLRKKPGRVAGWLHRLWADSWAVPTLATREDFTAALRDNGFENIEFKSLRWRVAPSALHIPVLATRFTLVELWKARGRLSPWRRKHIVASYCALALGMFWRDFDYGMVTATRRA